MALMRVLLWVPAAGEIAGGHRVQFEQTAVALRSLGVDVIVTWEPEPNLEGHDLVHGYGLSPRHVRSCRVRGLPVCLSTIYWSRRYTLGLDQGTNAARGMRRRLRLGAGMAVAGMALRHADKATAILESQIPRALAYESADVLLPNSDMEAAAIRDELGTTTPAVVVPNGIDAELFGAAQVDARPRGATVLYVGRFEPHKNQLGLIRALKDRPYTLTLVGPKHPHHPGYYDQCRAEARQSVQFVCEVTQRDLVQLYTTASVHACPSWYETTGLVSLEAAACGASVVSTNRGYAYEYLGDLAWYCDPGDPRSIADAVDRAMAAPRSPALRERVLQRFTWDAAAAATLEAYRQVLRAPVDASTSTAADGMRAGGLG